MRKDKLKEYIDLLEKLTNYKVILEDKNKIKKTEIRNMFGTPDQITLKLDSLRIKALLLIYDYQTSEEQHNRTTNTYNNIGFTGPDANILSSFAQQVIKYGSLSPKQMNTVRNKMPKYSRQLADIANEVKKSGKDKFVTEQWKKWYIKNQNNQIYKDDLLNSQEQNNIQTNNIQTNNIPEQNKKQIEIDNKNNIFYRTENLKIENGQFGPKASWSNYFYPDNYPFSNIIIWNAWINDADSITLTYCLNNQNKDSKIFKYIPLSKKDFVSFKNMIDRIIARQDELCNSK